MTDARLPSRWLTDPDMDVLTDRAWRVLTAALMLSAGAGADGRIARKSARFLYPTGVDAATTAELEQAGFWTVTADGGYQVLNWAATQSLAADVEKQRERNRRNQQAKRDREKGADVSGDIPGDVSGDIPGESSRQGQDRQGSVRELELAGNSDPPCPDCQRSMVFNNTPCNQHRRHVA